MNVPPIPTLSDRVNEIRHLTAEIVNDEILPDENELWRHRRDDDSGAGRARALELRHEIQDRVKQAGLSAPREESEE